MDINTGRCHGATRDVTRRDGR